MKLLTFLGKGKYEETIYVHQGREHRARFSPLASCHFLQPDELMVFVTEEAQEKVYPAFLQDILAGLKVTPVPVPLGENNLQLWQLFGIVSQTVQPGEEVAFDITHGLRSFPLIGLLAAAFLRAGLRVNLRAVLYGAFDVRDQNTTPHRTPVFDLTGLIELLDWAVAAERFNRSGDARALSEIIKNQRKSMAEAAQGDPERLARVGQFAGLASSLEDISQALRLIRPLQAMPMIAGLPGRIQQAAPVLAETPTAQPLQLLLENLQQAYQPLALEQETIDQEPAEFLRASRTMIHWYIEREQWVQAVSLAREWVVSWTMLQLGLRRLFNPGDRQSTESVLSTEAQAWQEARKKVEIYSPGFLRSVTQAEAVLEIWSGLPDLRNDVLHAGFREQPGKAEDLIKNFRKVIVKIDDLLLP